MSETYEDIREQLMEFRIVNLFNRKILCVQSDGRNGQHEKARM